MLQQGNPKDVNPATWLLGAGISGVSIAFGRIFYVFVIFYHRDGFISEV